jgi:hypothetical protein
MGNGHERAPDTRLFIVVTTPQGLASGRINAAQSSKLKARSATLEVRNSRL